MKKLLLIFVLLMPAFAYGQRTLVSAHLQDNNGSVYQNCGFNAIFVGESSQPGPYLVSGSVFQQSVDGVRCDSSGNLSLTVTSNGAIAPTPSQWQFNFCDQTGKYCGQTVITINGTTQNVSAQLQAVAPLLPTSGGSGGYNTIQDEGAGLTQQHILNLRGAGVNCTNDAPNVRTNCDISGSVTSPGGSSGQFQGNSGGVFAGIPGLSFTIPTGTESSGIKSTCTDNVCTANASLNFNVAPASPSTLSAGANTVNFTNCPDGVNGTDTVAASNPHYVLIVSGGGDTAPNEPVFITGGTCASGQAGSITFNAGFAHSGGYHIASATSGIQEAVQLTGPNPGAGVKLVAHTTYTCNAPIFLSRSDMTFDGQWAELVHNSFDSCLVMGARATYGSISGNSTQDVFHLRMHAAVAPWTVQPTGSISGSNASETITIPTCPTGFYAAIPNQVLWVAGTSGGKPTTPYGYGEPVVTTGTGTCIPGLTNGTVQITALVFVNTTISAHGSGYSLTSGVSPYIEDALVLNGHVHDARWVSNNGPEVQGYGIMVDGDQSFHANDLNMDAGFWIHQDINFQGAAIFAPGPFNPNASVGYIGPNVNTANAGSCVKWFSGNDLVYFSNICQNYVAGGAIVGDKRGGFGRFTIRDIHFENGSITPIWGSPLGDPPIIIVGGANTPVAIRDTYATGSGFNIANGAAWPNYANRAGETYWFYYLIAHNNTMTGCTSGGDCVTPPVLIGFALTNDPSSNPVTVKFYGWGSGIVQSPDNNPSTYDLLRVSATSSTYPPPPVNTANMAVATAQAVGSICDIHNVCTITDNVATGSLASYTPVYLSSSTKKYYTPAQLLGGDVVLTPSAGVNLTVPPAVRSQPTCLNAMEFFGANFIGSFADSPMTAIDSGIESCPQTIAPISARSSRSTCINSAGTCVAAGSGSSVIAASATTVTISTTDVTLWSKISVTENSANGTRLGVTCNTATGRTYSVTAMNTAVNFTITASSAPSVNPACLDWRIVNE